MSEGLPQDTPAVSEETTRLAEYGRTGVAPETPPAQKAERPADVPEKFWDADKGELNTAALLKSYGELEKMRGKPPEETPSADDPPAQDDQQADEEAPAGDEPAPEGDPAADPSPALQDAMTAAAEAYATSGGELPQENRDALVALGIPAATIDLYLAGVKAQELALEAEVHGIAGGADDYKAAVAWAATALTPEEIEAFDGSLTGKGMRTAVMGLMAQYRAANPSEGRLTATTTGMETGAVYSDRSEFLKDLKAADDAGDKVARREAVAKLERSTKAGTIPRSSNSFHQRRT